MKKKILIVEDDSCIRHLLIEAFEAEGYATTSANNGLEALVSLEESPPDLIVLDMMMPLMCGSQFRKEQLKNSYQIHIPLLAMSAQHFAPEELEEVKIQHFIEKPLELNELFQKVETLLA